MAARWCKKNPGKVSAIRARRHAQINAAIEEIDRQKIYERDKGICYLCGEPVDSNNWHLDHIIPLARGGEHVMTNVAVTHPFCNQSKNAKLPEELGPNWLERIRNANKAG